MEKSCPLGHVCERCLWNLTLYENKASGEVEPKPTCAIVANVIMLEEARNRVTGVQRAVESRGNETIKRQDAFLDVVQTGRITGGN